MAIIRAIIRENATHWWFWAGLLGGLLLCALTGRL